MANGIYVSDGELSAIAIHSSSQHTAWTWRLNVQMYCDSPRSEVVDPKDTANHIPSEIVEY